MKSEVAADSGAGSVGFVRVAANSGVAVVASSDKAAADGGVTSL